MKIGILEDETVPMNTVMSYLYRYMADNKLEFDIKPYRSSDSFLKDFDGSFDMLLLDIEMKGLSGMDVAKEVRRRGSNAVIIFITNMAKYALTGYEVHAADYILKPVSYPDFAIKFKRALKLVEDDRDKSVVINADDGIITLPVKTITYVEVIRNYCYYHTLTSCHKVRTPIYTAEEQLSKYSFARINNCYLVNMRNISKVSGDDVYVGEDVLKISAKRKTDFLSKYTRFIGGM